MLQQTNHHRMALFRNAQAVVEQNEPFTDEPRHKKNLSLGFANRSDPNQSAQLQRLAEVLKLWI